MDTLPEAVGGIVRHAVVINVLAPVSGYVRIQGCTVWEGGGVGGPSREVVVPCFAFDRT